MKAPTKYPVSVNHPDYKKAMDRIRRVRDACKGSDAIKDAGEEYLPRLSGHKRGPAGDAKYAAYLKRALWYNATRRTRIGLSGAATLRPPKTTVSDDSYQDLVDDLVEERFKLMDEALEAGRFAIVVNQIGSDTFHTIWYAESIVNWDYIKVEGEMVLSLLVLETDEVTERLNIFEKKCSTVRHVYNLQVPEPTTDGTGELSEVDQAQFECFYEKWTKNDKDEWTNTIPSRPVTALGGRALDHIPAIISGAMSLEGCEIEEPVLLDIVDVNISHYQNSADLEHGRHWTALPTAVASGFPTMDRDGQPIEFAVGSEVAWITEQSGASASYLEFSGSGLGHLQTGMTEKQGMMAIMGGRLLEEPKGGVEASETLKTRLQGEKSVLSRIASTVSAALTWSLEELIWFTDPLSSVDDPISDAEPDAGAEDEEEDIDSADDAEDAENSIKLNTDYLDAQMSPQQLTALTATLQSGSISFETFFQRLLEAEVYPEGTTIEEERKRIDAGLPGQKSKDPFAAAGGGFGGTGGFGGNDFGKKPDPQDPNAEGDGPPAPPFPPKKKFPFKFGGKN
jgi:hypothetical protein